MKPTTDNRRVKEARERVDSEILKMNDLLDQVQYQADRIKEALESERRAG